MKHLKSPLVRRVNAHGHHVTALWIETLVSAIREEVWASGKLRIQGFGTFEVRSRKPRTVDVTYASGAREKRTTEVPAHKVVTFRASKNWRRRNG